MKAEPFYIYTIFLMGIRSNAAEHMFQRSGHRPDRPWLCTGGRSNFLYRPSIFGITFDQCPLYQTSMRNVRFSRPVGLACKLPRWPKSILSVIRAGDPPNCKLPSLYSDRVMDIQGIHIWASIRSILDSWQNFDIKICTLTFNFGARWMKIFPKLIGFGYTRTSSLLGTLLV